MGVTSVLVAAAAAWLFGAAWYLALAQTWIAVSGVPVDAAGRPVNGGAGPHVLSALALVVVAGMMRHAFVTAGIDGAGRGLAAGFGLGAFVALPWILINCTYAARPRALIVIDGGYCLIGTTVIGLVLGMA